LSAKLVPTLADRMVAHGQLDGSLQPYSQISRPEPTFSFKYLLSCTHEAVWALLETHYFTENLVAPGIEPAPLDL
jgi:hypothetical protein